MPNIELETQSLPQLRELARLHYFPELAETASTHLLARMTSLATAIQSLPQSNYLGREHFDAFAAVNSESFNRIDSGTLFNHLVIPERYDTPYIMRPRRLLFGLLPHQIGAIVVTDLRDEVGLGEYPDEKPVAYSTGDNTPTRHAIQRAIKVGSFLELVTYGQQHKMQKTPGKRLTVVEQFASRLASHVTG